MYTMYYVPKCCNFKIKDIPGSGATQQFFIILL